MCFPNPKPKMQFHIFCSRAVRCKLNRRLHLICVFCAFVDFHSISMIHYTNFGYSTLSKSHMNGDGKWIVSDRLHSRTISRSFHTRLCVCVCAQSGYSIQWKEIYSFISSIIRKTRHTHDSRKLFTRSIDICEKDKNWGREKIKKKKKPNNILKVLQIFNWKNWKTLHKSISYRAKLSLR